MNNEPCHEMTSATIGEKKVNEINFIFMNNPLTQEKNY
jgi:hypothetical protein